jgi:hypothetical protein
MFFMLSSDFQDANVVRPANGTNQTIYLKAQATNQPSQQHYRPVASNLQVVYVGQENPKQLESVQLVPISVPARPASMNDETVNNKPASTKDQKKTIKITSSAAQTNK